jgi:hypothetical protein
MSSQYRPLPVFSILSSIFAIPSNLLAGLVVGLAAPVAAIAAMVLGVRLLTGKVPFLGHTWEDEEGGRHLSFKLVPPEEVRDLFEVQKEEIGGDLSKMKTEIRAIIEEAKAGAQPGAPEEDEGGDAQGEES